MSPDGIHRRSFLVGGAAALTTAVATTALAPSAHADTATPPRAAVLEYLDQWTKATGLAELLRRAGFTVVPLDTTKAATAQGVDLIAFGSFTNNGTAYPAYVAAQAAALRDFVAAGGTVLDLAQSDQYGAPVSYLPTALAAVRTDTDYDTVLPVAAGHPLVAALPVTAGKVLTGRAAGIRVSWETVGSWRGMRVLLACTTSGTSPALLEGAYGAGRFLVTSLTVDKCFNSAGTAIQPASAVQDSVAFFTALAGYVTAVRAGAAPPSRPPRCPRRPRSARWSATSTPPPRACGPAPAWTRSRTRPGAARCAGPTAGPPPWRSRSPPPTTIRCWPTSPACRLPPATRSRSPPRSPHPASPRRPAPSPPPRPRVRPPWSPWASAPAPPPTRTPCGPGSPPRAATASSCSATTPTSTPATSPSPAPSTAPSSPSPNSLP